MTRRPFIVVPAALLAAVLLVSGCHRKNRLTSSDFDFRISPPASTVVRGSTVTLTAVAGNTEVNPVWSVSGVGSVSTDLGRQVDFLSDTLGDAVVTATYDGVSASAQIAVVSFVPTSNILQVYSDSLFPTMTNVVGDNPIFDGSTFNLGSSAELNSGYTPDGVKYFRITFTKSVPDNMYWGIVLNGTPNTVDVSAYTSLEFALRINHTGGLGAPPVNVLIEIQDTNAVKRGVTLTGAHGLNRISEDWQEIRILRTEFSAQGVDTSALRDPFIITLQNCPVNTTFDVDAIRWEK